MCILCPAKEGLTFPHPINSTVTYGTFAYAMHHGLTPNSRIESALSPYFLPSLPVGSVSGIPPLSRGRVDAHPIPAHTARIMKLGIQSRLFLAFISTISLVVAAMVFAVNWSFQRGLEDYLQQVELGRLGQAVSTLSQTYGQHGDWEFLRHNRRAWSEIMEQGLSRPGESTSNRFPTVPLAGGPSPRHRPPPGTGHLRLAIHPVHPPPALPTAHTDNGESAHHRDSDASPHHPPTILQDRKSARVSTGRPHRPHATGTHPAIRWTCGLACGYSMPTANWCSVHSGLPLRKPACPSLGKARPWVSWPCAAAR